MTVKTKSNVTRREKWHVKVPLRSNKIGSNPFRNKIDSLNVMAVVLSFYDHRPHACQLLQLLCHEARSYIISQEGLPGFLLCYSIIDFFDTEFKEYPKGTGLACSPAVNLEANLKYDL